MCSTEGLENRDNSFFESLKNYLADNSDKVIKISVSVLSFLSLLFSVIFWCLGITSNIILFAVFSCGVSAYGIYLAISDLDDTHNKK